MSAEEEARALERVLRYDAAFVPRFAQRFGRHLLDALDLGHSRYAEVARAFEKAIDEGKRTAALAEIPYLLAEIGEPGGVKLCTKLLKHAEPDVVGAAIEALASLGDANAIKDIEKLKNDKRPVPQEEELDSGEFTVGELAADAVEHLRSLRG